MRGECVSVDQAGSSTNKRVKAQLITSNRKKERNKTKNDNVVVKCLSRLRFQLFCSSDPLKLMF